MTTEVERLKQRLIEGGISLISVFPGTNPMTTREDLAAEMNKALDMIEAGEFKESTFNDRELVE
jgi:DNA topoisomerase IA